MRIAALFVLLMINASAQASGYHCDMSIGVANGPATESKPVWSGTLLPYNTIYIDVKTAETRECRKVLPECAGHLYLKMTTGIAGGLFFHVGRILGVSNGLYDATTDLTLSNLGPDIHLTYWRENDLIVDCKSLE